MTPIEDLTALLSRTTRPLFVKVMARNDHIWADRKKGEAGKGMGKQYGIYVPADIRQRGFFPEQIQRTDKTHIFDRKVPTFWPQLDVPRTFFSNYVHYSNKGPECHLTGLPKELFQGLPPSSLIVIAQPENPEKDGELWEGLVIPSGTSDYYDTFELLGLAPGFLYDLVDLPGKNPDEELAEALLKALTDGTLHELIGGSALKTGQEFARDAQTAFLGENKIASFDAFSELKNAGDAVLRLCDIQFLQYRSLELRLRAAQLLQLLHAVRPGLATPGDTVRAAVSAFPEILELFKSVRGARASRMGTAFELHIGRVLSDSAIPFQAQQKIGNRKPDFILPSSAAYKKNRDNSLILTAKSTLRERWQQILNEGIGTKLYLATLDRSITDQSLTDLHEAGVTLVVPEQFVASGRKGRPGGVYKDKTNVISFSTFLEKVPRAK